jgi:hypothetical protein
MRLTSALFAVAVLSVAAMPAQAWWGDVKGNDTGGIISWSPEVEPVFHQMAADHCARWNKEAVITSVHRWYGDYVGFSCRWPRGYDPAKAMYRPFN